MNYISYNRVKAKAFDKTWAKLEGKSSDDVKSIAYACMLVISIPSILGGPTTDLDYSQFNQAWDTGMSLAFRLHDRLTASGFTP